MSASNAPRSPTTAAATKRWLAERLVEAGIKTAELDAQRLLTWATGLSQEALYVAPNQVLPPDALSKVEGALAQRRCGKSVARIVGQRAFWTLDLDISAATLEPRPETELLVERILERVRALGLVNARLSLLDVGVGCGAILLALLSELPNAVGFGLDFSGDALRVARGNAARFGLSGRCHFVQGDYIAPVSMKCIDILVSNPPYIPSATIPTLSEEVRGYDPALALDGGATGLDAYKEMIGALNRFGLPRLGVWFEIGFDQESAVLELVNKRDGGLLGTATCHADLALLPRCIEILPEDGHFDENDGRRREKVLGKDDKTG